MCNLMLALDKETGSLSTMAAQQIEALEPVHSESTIRVPHKPLDKSQPKKNESDSLKQELKISYTVTLPRYTQSPTQYMHRGDWSVTWAGYTQVVAWVMKQPVS
jgi:predicted glycosyltransferase